ncbi:hypothetical protein WJX74_003945 [Apatococcus lobatus]|uniref:PDZ domain-containing protein n=1 Tax=Apatococcus lobatus TaxID=904363 RepID=A0AAW1S1T8_9CHLO
MQSALTSHRTVCLHQNPKGYPLSSVVHSQGQLRRGPPQRSFQRCRGSVQISVPSDEGMDDLSETFNVPEGSELKAYFMKRPLGVTMVEKSGKVVVDHVMDGGHGDKAGIKVGDVLRATTARTKNMQRQGMARSTNAANKASVFGELVLLRADGEDFNTVMAGIQSSKCGQCDVAVVLERSS